ncbi:amino acid ABC transporter substrate-binding protein [Pelagibacterium xiamenense]|uniref:amino acid ABC transporter substrate-binding protein n=1 Tax=Pelagibacterium xiamenense TaxID=2901140 RepID=UPI001E499428|nr:amino acid ABC transporter substrate-binding protein [Pelagibacterium xiamenense]MCD7060881.1 amino acid ABC transporter substrate-binding protein [Pelagibacterium xiamenense]
MLCAFAAAGLPAGAQESGDGEGVPAASTPFTISTLETVRARGYVICATSQPMAGFAQVSSEGLWSGFDVDICRGVAAAVFGDPSRVEFRPLSGTSRFAHLALGEVDLLARNAPWTMMRDTAYGASYAATSFYDGQAFMVPDSLGVVSAYELDDVTVCVASGGEALARVNEFFFDIQGSFDEVLYEDREDLAVAYRSGQCDAISASASWLHGVRRTLPEPGTHRILPERLSKEPYGPVVRSGDTQWFTIVRWVVLAMINAEELGVTSVNVESMLSARAPAIRSLLGLEGDFGTPLGLSQTWMRDVVSGVGNYGEVYARHFGPDTGTPLLRGQNALWINGGLMFAPPFN